MVPVTGGRSLTRADDAPKTASRRALVAIMLAAAVLPRLAWAQDLKSKEARAVRIRLTFNGQSLTAMLDENPSARDFTSLLPLDLSIDDYAHNEKVAYLPRKLSEEGSAPFTGEAAGDLCYYSPWGNLAMFYGSYRYSKGLVRLGRFVGSIEPLLTRGRFPLRIERI